MVTQLESSRDLDSKRFQCQSANIIVYIIILKIIKIQIPALVKSKDKFLIEKLGKFYAKLSVYCSKAQFRFFPSCTMHPFLAHPNSHFGNQHGFDAVFSCCSSTFLFSLFSASDVVSLCSSNLSNH